MDGCTEPGNFPDWTKILTSAGDMVQNVFNNDEWGLSVEIILGINSNTYVQRFWESVESVEKQYHWTVLLRIRLLRLAHDCEF